MMNANLAMTMNARGLVHLVSHEFDSAVWSFRQGIKLMRKHADRQPSCAKDFARGGLLQVLPTNTLDDAMKQRMELHSKFHILDAAFSVTTNERSFGYRDHDFGLQDCDLISAVLLHNLALAFQLRGMVLGIDPSSDFLRAQTLYKFAYTLTNKLLYESSFAASLLASISNNLALIYSETFDHQGLDECMDIMVSLLSHVEENSPEALLLVTNIIAARSFKDQHAATA